MIESGCKYCPVTHCCASYRGSECSVKRAKYGLGDPKTNDDRIRAMSGKELKAWYCKNRDCGTCDFCRPFGCTFEDWLQQPAEEEHHE